MDFATSRRVGTTYGRTAKRLVIHDLFENLNGADSASKPTSSELSPLLTQYKDPTPPKASKPNTTIRDPDGKTLRSRPVSPGRSSKLNPARTKGAHPSLKDEMDLFDIRSSEDENTRRPESNSRKRQRVLQVPRDARSASTRQATTLTQKSENAPVRILKTDQKPKQKAELKKKNKDLTGVSVAQHPRRKPTASQVVGASVEAPKRSKQRPAPRVKPPLPLQPVVGDVMLIDDFASTDVSANLTDFSSRSVGSRPGSPKRKRHMSLSSEDNMPSPSQLGITSLRLTPERRSAVASRLTSPGISSDDGETPRRVRPRLIDRLDGPAQAEHGTPDAKRREPPKVEETKTPDTQRRARGRTRVQTQVNSDQPISQPALDRSQSSQGRATYATKARTTYAKERSHLSDMVDSLDPLGAPSSQQINRDLFLQATTSNLASGLDFEEDESDNQSGAKILKSIHELRQAGAMSRFDREVQALLEDIEVASHTNKSIRLRALMKLIRRLGDEAFLRYFVSSGRILRLTRCSVSFHDTISKTLLVVVLYILSKVETSLEVLTSIFTSAVELAPNMLKTPKSLSGLVQDPAEKIAKSSIKELLTFEEYLVSTKSLATLSESVIRPDCLVLTLLDETLRNVTRLGERNAKMSPKCYVQVLQLLERHAQRLTAQQDVTADLPVLEKALSLMEVCSMVFDNMEVDVQANQYQKLGESLATIMRSITDEQETLEQSILKAVVSLSNSKPRMCQLLGQSPITDAVFFTIDIKFVSVADRAEHEQKLDQRKLDSVILALGCLLNFAECDSETRRKIAHTLKEGHTYLERLVAMFNSQVDKAQEVTTSEQSQVLVAFGYLSMLLCTMSLDPDIRTQITELLKDKSFEELCAAAETFFSHLRTLENISDDDASMSAFTARFSAILATIRSAPVLEG